MKTLTKSMIWICLCSVWFLMTQFGSELKAQMEYELYPYSNIGISASRSPASQGPLLCRYVLRADSLRNRGMLPGQLNGISFKVINASQTGSNRLMIRMALLADTLISLHIPQDSFSLVLDSMVQWSDTGWVALGFHQAFHWDGRRSVYIQICVHGDSTLSDSILGGTQVPFPRYASATSDLVCNTTSSFVPHGLVPCLRIRSAPYLPNCSAQYPSPGRLSTGLPREGVQLVWHTPQGIGEASQYRVLVDTIFPPVSLWAIPQGNDTSFHTSVLSANKRYFWQVIPENSGGPALNCSIDSFQTGPAYCMMSPLFSGGVKLKHLQFGNNALPVSNICGPYMLHTDTVILFEGDSLQATIRTGACQGSRPYYMSLSIDRNGDGDWGDIGELIFQSSQIQDTLFSFSTMIPTVQVSGYTRMRIALQELAPIPNVCGTYSYGDVHDIIVRIAPPPPPTCIQGLQSNLSALTSVCPDSQNIELGIIPGLYNGSMMVLATLPNFSICDTLAFDRRRHQTMGIVLQPSTQYYYRVQPFGPGGLSGLCTVDSFVTASQACADTACMLTGVQPLTGAQNVYPAGVPLSWSLPIGVMPDSVRIRADTVFPPVRILRSWVSSQTTAILYPWPAAHSTHFWSLEIKDRNGRVRNCTNAYTFHTLPDVCMPAIDEGNAYGDYISYVGIGAHSRSSGAIQNLQFFERWDSTVMEVQAGTICTLQVSPGTYPAGNYLAAWIDYNRDGLWAGHEKLGEVMVNAPMPAQGQILFTVPACTDTGYTILRVREAWGVSGMQPCDTYPYGETEEYIIRIIPAPPVAPNCPMSYAPLSTADTIPNSLVSLLWQESILGACAEHFKVYLGTDNPPTNTIQAQITHQRNLHTLTQLQGNMQYYWRIEPMNASGANTQCPIQHFKTCPVLPSPVWRPAQGITCNRFTLRWDTVPGATGYQIQVSSDSAFVHQLLADTASFSPQTDRKSISGFQSGLQYYCRIRSYSGCDTGAYSAILRVPTVSVPSMPAWTLPAASGCHEIELNWQASIGALHYQLDVSLDSTFQSFLSGYQQRQMLNRQTWIAGLRPSRPYYARVRAANTCGFSAWSPITSNATGRDTWLGFTSAWHNPSNWCSGYVPDSITQVYIPHNHPAMPIINQPAWVADIEVDSTVIITHSSSDTFRVLGNWINRGRFQSGNSTVSYCGYRPQIISGQDTLRHMIIRNLSGVWIDSASSITLRGYYTPILGPFYTRGNLRLLIDSTQQSGILKEWSPTAQTIGPVSIHQYNSRVGGPRLICSPFVNTAFGYWWSAHSRNPSLWQYSEPALGPREAGFQEIGNHFDTMSIGRGYWADIPANNSIQLSGLLQEGLIQIPVSFTVDPNNRSASGWNLVGNPYLCPIDWDAPTGIIRPNISTSIFMLDPQTGQQASYNNGIGTLGATAVIPPGQGFWIKAFAHNPQFIVDERCKTARSGKLFRGDLPIPQLRFQLFQHHQLWDECVYARRPGAMAGFKDAYDVEYFEVVPEKSKLMPRIWMEDENHFAYSIYNTEQQYPCKICMQIPSAGDWDFQFLTLGAMQDFTVADENNKVLNASQSYRFYAPDSGVYCPYTVLPTHPPDRLPFTDKRIITYPNPATQNDAIHIQFAGVVPDVGTSLKVIDMHGRTLWQDVFMQNELIIPANLFPVDGMYFLEASLYNTPVMKKILIQGVK